MCLEKYSVLVTETVIGVIVNRISNQAYINTIFTGSAWNDFRYHMEEMMNTMMGNSPFKQVLVSVTTIVV